jgi:ATP-dependent RNA helicase HelY
MPPSIHPVRLISVLRLKSLTPAIVFLTSRRSCDEALQSFEETPDTLPPSRQAAISTVLDELTDAYPSIADHPLRNTVTSYGIAAHHAGHLPSWKIAIEELMRRGCLDAVFATTTLAAGVDFPARTVVLTQSGVRRDDDFTDLSMAEVQQIAGRAGRRGKDSVGFAILTPSPYMDLGVLIRGLTGRPEPIDSQFVISYPMVLNLLKAHPLDHIQSILAKSFAQYQLNAQAERLELRNEKLHAKLESFGPRECSDWLGQWHSYDQATRQTAHKYQTRRQHPPDVEARLRYLTPGRVAAFPRFRGVVLRNYRSRGQHREMVTVLRDGGALAESAVADVTAVLDRVFDFAPMPTFPWAAPETLSWLGQQLGTLPKQLPALTLVKPVAKEDGEELVKSLGDLYPCPACRCRPTCAKEFSAANKVKQEWTHNARSIQSIRTGLWHKFQERADVLRDLGYLDTAYKLTADGDWARFIRIDSSLLITELIRAQAFAHTTPPILAGVMACIAYENDRPASFPRISPGLAALVAVVRRMSEALAPYDDSPLLRADVAGLAERWVGDTTVSWAQLCRSTSTAEGDVYRLLSRTLEYLSQIHALRDTHRELSGIAAEAMDRIRRGVLEELP